jgi:hypothetical protein
MMRSLLTWNIRGGGKRIAAIISTLQQHDADVLVLTEYCGTGACRELSSALSAQGWTCAETKPSMSIVVVSAGIRDGF